MIGLTFDDHGDIASDGVQLLTDNGLEPAVFLSLFLDAYDGEESDPRGWWADAVPDRIGSFLWKLEREKLTESTRAAAEEYATAALQWMVVDGIAESVKVTATIILRETIHLDVTIKKPKGDSVNYKYAYAWNAQADKAGRAERIKSPDIDAIIWASRMAEEYAEIGGGGGGGGGGSGGDPTPGYSCGSTYFDNTKWQKFFEWGPEVFSGGKWSSTSFYSLEPIGGWATGFRPSKIKLRTYLPSDATGSHPRVADVTVRDTAFDIIGTGTITYTANFVAVVTEIDLTFGAEDIGRLIITFPAYTTSANISCIEFIE